MTGTWICLLLIAAVIGCWLDALRAREQAIALGRALCRDAGVQLLDETVSLKRLRVARRDGLPTFVRRYGFEVSVNGRDRHRGHLDIGAHRLESWSLPLAQADADIATRPDHLRVVQ